MFVKVFSILILYKILLTQEVKVKQQNHLPFTYYTSLVSNEMTIDDSKAEVKVMD